MEKLFLGRETATTDFARARFAVIPVPYERTTSYQKGTAAGPQAILDASPYLEFYDEELQSEPFRAGVFTLPPLGFSGEFEEDFNRIRDRVSETLSENKFPIVLGGEHSITSAVVAAFKQKYPDLTVLQLDAHSDLRDSYEGTRYSHACVMRRIFEQDVPFVQVGIRAQDASEAQFARNHDIPVFYAHQLHDRGFPQEILDRLNGHVFITFDLDFFDPGVMPATGTPEPGGFFWPETIRFLRKVFQKKKVVGADIVELSPINGLVYPDFTAAKLAYKMIALKEYSS